MLKEHKNRLFKLIQDVNIDLVYFYSQELEGILPVSIDVKKLEERESDEEQEEQKKGPTIIDKTKNMGIAINPPSSILKNATTIKKNISLSSLKTLPNINVQ